MLVAVDGVHHGRWLETVRLVHGGRLDPVDDLLGFLLLVYTDLGLHIPTL